MIALFKLSISSWFNFGEFYASKGLLWWVKNPSANVGDTGLIPRSGRSPGEGSGSPLQYSCLGNPMDRGAWWATVHGVAKWVGRGLVTKNNISRSCSFFFFLACQICWHIIVHSILLWSLYFCGISWDFSFFISYFVFSGFSLFSF